MHRFKQKYHILCKEEMKHGENMHRIEEKSRILCKEEMKHEKNMHGCLCGEKRKECKY